MKKFLAICLMCLLVCNIAVAEPITFGSIYFYKSVTDYSDEYFTRGSISYDCDNNILTFNNVDITYTSTSSLVLCGDNLNILTIKLIGENHIVSEGSFLAARANGDFRIEGTGSLDFSTSYIRGIDLGHFDQEGESFLTIKDCDVKIKTKRESINGSQSDNSDKGVLTVTFDNAHAELFGYTVTTWQTFYYPAISEIKDIILKNCTYTEPSAPYVGQYYHLNGILEDVDGEPRGVIKLVISPTTDGISQQSINRNTSTVKRMNTRNQLEIEKNGHTYNEAGIKIK